MLDMHNTATFTYRNTDVVNGYTHVLFFPMPLSRCV